MAEEAFESLTDEQQLLCATRSPRLRRRSRRPARGRRGGAHPLPQGLTFAAASESDLAELRAAFEPVYADLTNDAETKSYIDAISDLKTEIAASAEHLPATPGAGSPRPRTPPGRARSRRP